MKYKYALVAFVIRSSEPPEGLTAAEVSIHHLTWLNYDICEAMDTGARYSCVGREGIFTLSLDKPSASLAGCHHCSATVSPPLPPPTYSVKIFPFVFM